MNNDLQQRFSAFEAPPPADAWPRLAAALEEDALRQKLEGFSPAPPAGAWEKIAAGLSAPAASETQSPVRRIRPWSLAAAAVLLLLAGGAYLGLRNSGEPPIIVQENPLPEPSAQGPDTVVFGRPLITETPPTQSTAAAGSAIRPMIQRMAQRAGLVKRPAGATSTALLSYSDAAPEPMAMIPQEAVRAQTIAFSMPAERYLIYSDEEGRAMRLPCRLYDLVACEDGDDPCRQRLARLQQQAALAGGLTTDFTGMLDLLRRLGENQ